MANRPMIRKATRLVAADGPDSGKRGARRTGAPSLPDNPASAPAIAMSSARRWAASSRDSTRPGGLLGQEALPQSQDAAGEGSSSARLLALGTRPCDLGGRLAAPRRCPTSVFGSPSVGLPRVEMPEARGGDRDFRQTFDRRRGNGGRPEPSSGRPASLGEGGEVERRRRAWPVRRDVALRRGCLTECRRYAWACRCRPCPCRACPWRPWPSWRSGRPGPGPSRPSPSRSWPSRR